MVELDFYICNNPKFDELVNGASNEWEEKFFNQFDRPDSYWFHSVKIMDFVFVLMTGTWLENASDNHYDYVFNKIYELDKDLLIADLNFQTTRAVEEFAKTDNGREFLSTLEKYFLDE